MPNTKIERFYAVKVGRKTGILTDWNECKASVLGFDGAKYKSFIDRKEAEDFLYGGSKRKPVVNKNTVVAYINGSFNDITKKYGSGVVLLFNNKTTELSQSGASSELVKMRNIGGELAAVSMAIKKAIRLSAKRIVIHYDYAGIENWANGSWRANKTGTIEYKDFIERKSKDIEIVFSKVTAHSGNKYNGMAKKLAKKAVGIE